MSTKKQRRPTGPILYVVFWIGAVWIGLGLLGSLPNLISDFQRDKSSAFAVLFGELIVLAIGVFCVLEIIEANKARREKATEARPEPDAQSPVPSPPTMHKSGSTEYTNEALLGSLKEELFTLETEKLSGKITPEHYAEARAALETRLKLVTGTTVQDISTPESAEPQPGLVPNIPNRLSPWIAVPIFVVLGWTALLAFRRYGISAYAIGDCIGSLIFPFLIAYAVAGVKQRRNWITFSCVLLGLGIVLPSATNQRSLASLSRADMLKELSGAKPLEDNLPENEKEVASASKAFFADIRAFRKLNDEQLEALEPDLTQLYTSVSFSSKDAIQRSLTAVDRKLSLDQETLAMIERVPEMARTRINQTNLSDSQKEDFMNGVMKSFTASEYNSAFRQMIAIESGWADSADDLYGFALKHSSQIAVTTERIGIANGTVRETFNTKLARSKGLLDDYLATAKKTDAARTANFKNNGVTESGLGFGK